MNLIKQSKAQGIGRHTNDEVYDLAVRELKAIDSFIDSKKYFTGEKISSIDATVYAFLILILKQPISSPLKSYIEGRKSLMTYCDSVESLIG